MLNSNLILISCMKSVYKHKIVLAAIQSRSRIQDAHYYHFRSCVRKENYAQHLYWYFVRTYLISVLSIFL